jgi:hypothetical protein
MDIGANNNLNRLLHMYIGLVCMHMNKKGEKFCLRKHSLNKNECSMDYTYVIKSA